MPTTLLSIEAVAAEAQRSPSRIRQWIRVGLLAGGRRVKLRVHSSQGSRDLISLDDLAAFREECREARYGAAKAETARVLTEPMRKTAQALRDEASAWSAPRRAKPAAK